MADWLRRPGTWPIGACWPNRAKLLETVATTDGMEGHWALARDVRIVALQDDLASTDADQRATLHDMDLPRQESLAVLRRDNGHGSALPQDCRKGAPVVVADVGDDDKGHGRRWQWHGAEQHLRRLNATS